MQQGRLLELKELGRRASLSSESSLIGDLGQPLLDLKIELGDVDLLLADQRVVEASLEILIESLYLSLSLSPVGPTEPGDESTVVSEVIEGGLKLVSSFAIPVSLQDDAFHIIVEDFLWDASEEFECELVADDQRLDGEICDELDECPSAVSEDGDESGDFPHMSPIDLHLLSWRRFESDDLWCFWILEGPDEGAYSGDASWVALIFDFVQQDGVRNFRALFDSLYDVRLVRVEYRRLGRSFFVFLVFFPLRYSLTVFLASPMILAICLMDFPCLYKIFTSMHSSIVIIFTLLLGVMMTRWVNF